jgi:hypothetical protein
MVTVITRLKPIRRLFAPEEDALLFQIMTEQQFSSWVGVACQIPGRSPRQCRDRWSNYLSPANKNGPWTQAEDALLVAKFAEFGPRWATIAKFFDGRSENNVKNRWYTHVKSKINIASSDSAASPSREPVELASVGAKTVLPPITLLDPHPPWEGEPERNALSILSFL